MRRRPWGTHQGAGLTGGPFDAGSAGGKGVHAQERSFQQPGVIGMIGFTFLDDQTGQPELISSTPSLFGTRDSSVSVADATTTRDCGMSSSAAPGGSGSVAGRHDQTDYADVGATGRDVSGGTAEEATTHSQGRHDAGTRGAETGRVRLRNYVVTEQGQEVVPRIPIKEGAQTTGGIIAAVAAWLVMFSGAILGGLAGLRVHRELDKARLGH
jgi:hypothetical protein